MLSEIASEEVEDTLDSPVGDGQVEETFTVEEQDDENDWEPDDEPDDDPLIDILADDNYNNAPDADDDEDA